MIESSVKEDDPLTVGRFGLGFKSVFHLTGKVGSSYWKALYMYNNCN